MSTPLLEEREAWQTQESWDADFARIARTVTEPVRASNPLLRMVMALHTGRNCPKPGRCPQQLEAQMVVRQSRMLFWWRVWELLSNWFYWKRGEGWPVTYGPPLPASWADPNSNPEEDVREALSRR